MVPYTPPPQIAIVVVLPQKVVLRQTTCDFGWSTVQAYPGQVFTIAYTSDGKAFGLLSNMLSGSYCSIPLSDLG